jgi:low temperature requirement protein LtrA
VVILSANRMSFGAPTNMLRRRDGARSAPVTQVELFFDLVFVFAVTQLSQTLHANLSPLGALHTLMLFIAVWWVWMYTSWITNWLDPEQRYVRLLLLVLMLAGLVLSTCLPAAFGNRAFGFAGAYVFMQVGRSVFMLWAVKNFDAANYRNFQRIICWLLLAGAVWLAGAVLPAGPRLFVWLAAMGLDVISPALGFYVPGLGRSATSEWNIDSFHLAERCAGFILIALGESITVTGAAFYRLDWNLANGTAFLAAFLGAVAMWWIYFDTAAERTSHAFAKAADPGRLARSAYTYLHAVLVAGIIVVAVADEMLLAHPLHPASLTAILVTLGGPGLYLAGNGIFRRMLAPRFPPSHRYGLVLITLLAVAAPFISLLMLAGFTTLILVFVAAAGSILHHRQTK